MDKIQILSEIQSIMRDVLDDESIVLNEGTTANDVDGWDSLTYIQWIVAIEKRFKIKFSSKEIFSWNKVGDMLEGISLKSN